MEGSISSATAPRTLKIAIFVTGLDVGGVDGGAELSGLELARHLRRLGHSLVLFLYWRTSSKTENTLLATCESEGIRVEYLSDTADRSDRKAAIRALRRIRAVLLHGDFDVAHAHHEGAALGLALARISGDSTRMLRTAHVPHMLAWGRGVSAAVLRALVSGVLFPLTLDVEVAVASWQRDALQARFVMRVLKKHVALIFNARDVIVSTPQNRAQQSTTVIGFVGRLSEEKGPDLLVDAMPIVRREFPNRDVKALFVGDGPLRPELLQRVARLGLSESISFAGQVHDVLPLLRQFSVFALPSRVEGVSNALLEAIGAGIPVVASDVPGNLDVVSDGETAVIFQSGNSRELAAAISKLLHDPQKCLELAVRAQQILPRFSIERAAQCYVDQYLMIAQR